MKRTLMLCAFLSAISTAAQQPPAPVPPAHTANNCVDLPSLEKKVEELNDRLKDWAQLARYRDANTGVRPAAKGEARVVFMGDSITDMWQYPEFGGFFPGKPYIDRGIGGQTTAQMLLRFRPDVLALEPRVVVILAGTNDIAGNTGPMTVEETEGNLASMSELAHAHGVRVVLASLTPVGDLSTAEGKKVQTARRPPEKIFALNEWIKKYAGDHGDVYLDYFRAMSDDRGMLKPALTGDGLHPNAAGYTVMTPLAEKAIRQALAQTP